jgi:hypothetical protein
MMAVERSTNADPSEHRRAAELDHQYQRLDCCLPFGEGGFFLRKGTYPGRETSER